jgi:hypothetical protein
LLALAPIAFAQLDYSVQIGRPTFAVPSPVEMGFVNLANGNLHLEIPLGCFPQRGRVAFCAKLVYDSLIWTEVSNGSSWWWSPTNVPNSWGGWRLVTTADAGTVIPTVAQTNCGATSYYKVNWPFTWTAPDGTQHVFSVTTQHDFDCGKTNIASADALALDSTGYHMYVTNYTQATIYAPDGTIVHDDTQTAYTVKDPNGNFLSTDSSGNIIDTLGRTLVAKSGNGSGTFYYDVLNSQGGTSRFTVTTQQITAYTAFQASGVTNTCAGVTVVSAIQQPDGSSYSFTYDQIPSGQGCTQGTGTYGMLASMTLPGPAGGTITYTYTNFTGSSNLGSATNRWLNTRNNGSRPWTYAPATATSGCPSGNYVYGCQQVMVTDPDNVSTTYTFSTNNGAWNTQTQMGSLQTVVTTYDFTNVWPNRSSAAYIRKLSETTTLNGLNKQTTYTYDSPSNGNVTAIKEWNYYTGSPAATPDRETDFTY